jgi:hypothetical protein
LQVPDLKLVTGGWIKGRVVNALSGKPIPGTAADPLAIGLYGPSRPKSGAACQSVHVDGKGMFQLRVAPGRNFPYIMTAQREFWDSAQREAFFEKGIEVKPGEVVNLVLRVLPEKAH